MLLDKLTSLHVHLYVIVCHNIVCHCTYNSTAHVQCHLMFIEKELGHQISRIRGNVQSFQKMLADMKPGPTCKYHTIQNTSDVL